MLHLLVALVLCLTLAANADTKKIYKTIDEQGREVYTDTPPSDASDTEQLELQPTNTVAPPPNIARPDKPEKSQAALIPTVTIVSPADDSTIPMGPGNFAVSATTSPALTGGQKLLLKLDGVAQGAAQGFGNWSLTNIFRGQHSITVTLLDKSGEAITSSEPVIVYVHRPSVQFR